MGAVWDAVYPAGHGEPETVAFGNHKPGDSGREAIEPRSEVDD